VRGHSYGGWLSLAYAAHAPQRVSRLALLDLDRLLPAFLAEG
jgi:pimeloyl-ACP methyl ester carboxylesterase